MATAKWDIQDKFPEPLLRVVGQIGDEFMSA